MLRVKESKNWSNQFIQQTKLFNVFSQILWLYPQFANSTTGKQISEWMPKVSKQMPTELNLNNSQSRKKEVSRAMISFRKNQTNNRELWKNSNSGLNHCYIIMDYSFRHIIHALPVFYQLKCDAFPKKLQVLWTAYFFFFKGPNNEEIFKFY